MEGGRNAGAVWPSNHRSPWPAGRQAAPPCSIEAVEARPRVCEISSAFLAGELATRERRKSFGLTYLQQFCLFESVGRGKVT